MSSYYYITEKKNYCEECYVYHPEDNPCIRIGRCDINQNFILFVDSNIPDLETWKAQWEVPGTLIVDYNGQEISPIDMLTIITCRSGIVGCTYNTNVCEMGYHNLVRRKLGYVLGDHVCIGNYDTYDLLSPRF